MVLLVERGEERREKHYSTYWRTEMESFNLEDYGRKLSDEELDGYAQRDNPSRPTKKVKRKKRRGWFLKGPVYDSDITPAARVSYRALRVAIALWQLRGLHGSNVVKPTHKVWPKVALTPEGARVGLATLEKAGLVSVVRRAGCAPVVTLLDPAPSAPAPLTKRAEK